MIDKLSKFDKKKEVIILYGGDSPLDRGTAINDIFEINGSANDDYVFIQEDS